MRFSLVLISGLLMGISTATVGLWYLAWFALAPLLVILFIQQKTLLEDLLLGASWGVGFYGFSLWWLTGIHPMTWMGVPWLSSLFIALFCWLFVTLWGVSLVVLWTWGMRYLIKPKYPLVRIFAAPALWCILEIIYSNGPLWWCSLSYTQSPHNLIILQLSQLSGPTTITIAIVLINTLIAEGILHKQKSWGYIAITTFLTLHLIGWGMYSNPLKDKPQNAIKIGIIQGNIPNTIKLYPEGWRKAIQGYTLGYEKLAQAGNVDFILTPETALPFFWEDIVNNSTFYQAILKWQIPVALGAFGRKNDDYTNSIFAVNGKGQLQSHYDKVKLVPVGEYVPFAELLGGLVKRLSPLEAHLAAGKSQQILDTPVGRAIIAICYESAFNEHFRHQTSMGGEFILTASNDAHYSYSMPAQHHALDVMRAVENDRYAVRATNTGYSAIVEPKGRTLWISSMDTYEIHQGVIYRRDSKTLYVLWGDWLGRITLVMGVVITIGVVIDGVREGRG